MKSELKHHLLPLAAIFILTSILWLLASAPWFYFVYLFFGLLWGSFFLDLDHLIYWLYLQPQLPESQKAGQYLHAKDVKSLLDLLTKTHKRHTSLIFHHYFFQIALALISIFIITSSGSIFTSAFILALNLHLLVDEVADFNQNPTRLQRWLFAREPKQVPVKFLPHYLIFFALFYLLFLFMLISLGL